MKKFLFLFLLSIPMLHAQVVFEPLYNDVYKFLNRVSQKGIIQLDDNLKPLSRVYISGKLLEVENSKSKLTPLEKEELEFYKKDFSTEIYNFVSNNLSVKDSIKSNRVNHRNDITTENKFPGNSESNVDKDKYTLLNFDTAGRWRLFGYKDDLFKINVSPILGFETGKKDGITNGHTWTGLRFYGYLKDYLGFSFDYRDNSESGENIDKNKSFSNETGTIIARKSGNKIDYSEIRTNLSVNWSWGTISIGKDFMEWGYGESGKLVLSHKAPSFPFLRLNIKPVSWLSFDYFHAWLSSDVIDSNQIYATKSLRSSTAERIIYRDKYLASHTINIFPLKGLTLSLGESVIYSDKLEISYLMPLMFFRLADHYLSNANNNAGSNSQFFFGISSRNHLKNTHLYGTLFIDEITLTGLFDKQKQRNQFGFTLGSSVVDLPINNLTVTMEYTKIYPFVYTHYIATQTYESDSYGLGHWMGNNADLFYSSINYRILRGLQTTIWGEYIRKGEQGVIDQQYMQPQPPFLFGLNSNYLYGGIELKYEMLHDLYLQGRFQFSNISKEQKDGHSEKDKYSEFHVSLFYGL